MHQHALARLESGDVEQRLARRAEGSRQGCRLLETHFVGYDDQRIGAGQDAAGERATSAGAAAPHDAVPNLYGRGERTCGRHDAAEVGKRPAGDPDHVAGLEVDLDARGRLFLRLRGHADGSQQALHFFRRERHRPGRGTDEAGHAIGAAHDLPRLAQLAG